MLSGSDLLEMETTDKTALYPLCRYKKRGLVTQAKVVKCHPETNKDEIIVPFASPKKRGGGVVQHPPSPQA